jgi:peptidoglycan LD-endopeptidase CwlK
MLSDTSLARLGEVHPELYRRIVKLDAMIPMLNLQVTQGYRTFAQQDALYAQGRTAPGKIITDAIGAQSSHCYGYAVDVVPEDIMPGQPDWDLGHAAWKKILATAPSVGLAEGALFRTFPDSPHLYLQELPATPNDEMYTTFRESGLQAVWQSWA